MTEAATAAESEYEMDFAAWASAAGFDPANLTDQQKVSLQAAWRAEQNPARPRAPRTDEERLEALAKLHAERTPGPFMYAAQTDRMPQGALLEAGLLAHIGVSTKHIAKHFGDRVADATTRREFRVTGIQDIMRRFMASHGAHVPSGKFSDSDILDCFRLDRSVSATRRDAYGGSMQMGPSTLSVTGILSNTANKALLAGFDETPATWMKWAKTGSVDDFKTATRYRLIGTGEYKLVAPGGKLSHVSMTETDSDAKADTYGALIGIDRQQIINDDLGAFASAPRMLARMAAVKIEKLATEKLLENLGGTTSGFFSTGNANYKSGGGSALAAAGLKDAYQAFVEQTDPNGDPTFIVPKLLLVPPALETTALALVASMELVGTTTANALMPNGNPWSGKFDVIPAPYLADAYGLTNSSDTGWYLLAEPGDFSPVEVVFLGGRVAPTIETAELDFDRLGIGMRAFNDFGVNTLEHRGGVLSAGA